MVSGLFSAKTVVHLSTTPATAFFEHAVALCTETAALNTSTTALIPRRVCIISSLICSANHQSSVGSHCSSREHPGTRCGFQTVRLPRAASGHAAAPPRSVMNARQLLIRSPRRRGRAASAAPRGRALSGLDVDDHLDLRRKFDRQIAGLRALQNFLDKRSGPAGSLALVDAITHEAMPDMGVSRPVRWVFRVLSLARRHPQVLGAALNRSESADHACGAVRNEDRRRPAARQEKPAALGAAG